jgi:hypothetical protein
VGRAVTGKRIPIQQQFPVRDIEKAAKRARGEEAGGCRHLNLSALLGRAVESRCQVPVFSLLLGERQADATRDGWFTSRPLVEIRPGPSQIRE